MPSSPGYKRDYKKEGLYEASPIQKKRRAERNKAHRTLERALGHPIKGDVDHISPLSRGGSNAPSNWRVRSQHANRSYARTSSGAIK